MGDMRDDLVIAGLLKPLGEATPVTGLESTDPDEAERPSNPPNNHKE